jgi:hypothetical protein
MGPSATAVTAGLPTATSWYMNPYFMASFGAVVALGFVIFALAYFVFVKLKVGATSQPSVIEIKPEDRCGTCGMTTEMISKLMPCRAHEGLSVRVTTIDKWIESHEKDYREIRQRVDAIERGDKRAK